MTTKAKVDIRLASISDVPDLRFCARSSYSKYVNRMGQEPAPMNADFERLVAQGFVHLARMGEEFVGYVVFFGEGDHLQLENLAVLPTHSGKGIGKQLIEFVVATARNGGVRAVELYTNEAMTENLAMYPRLGFQETDRKCQDGFNRVFFRKSL
jgi:ribosomal protein S18 acetylase RimI-like enzyme